MKVNASNAIGVSRAHGVRRRASGYREREREIESKKKTRNNKMANIEIKERNNAVMEMLNCKRKYN